MIRHQTPFAFGSAIVLLMTASCGNARANGYSPNDGADDRVAIQAEIDRLAAEDGGTLQLESGTYDLSGPLFLRSGVTLAGRGAETLLSTVKFNSRSDWSGTIVFAGTLNPGSYDENGGVGYPAFDVTRIADNTMTLEDCDASRLGGLPGQVVWFSTEGGFAARNDFARPEYGVMNTVVAVDGCTVTLSDPIGIPESYAVRIHWSDGSKSLPANVGEPNVAIRDAAITDLRLETANGQAMLVTGCWRCRFTNLTMERTRRLFSVQGTRFSHYSNIRGNFTERGIELATYATENSIENVRGSYLPGTTRAPRPAIRFGEYARNNTLSDIVLNLGRAYATREKIRFDESGGNRLQNVRLVVSPEDNMRLHVYRGPREAKARRGALPPGTVLQAVELCVGDNAETCEASPS